MGRRVEDAQGGLPGGVLDVRYLLGRVSQTSDRLHSSGVYVVDR